MTLPDKLDPQELRLYYQIQKVLDQALGGGEDDGTGEGIVQDVALLAHRYDLALDALEEAGARAVAEDIRQAGLPA